MIERIVKYKVITEKGLMDGKATFVNPDSKEINKLYQKFMKKLLKDKKITNIQENDIVIE